MRRVVVTGVGAITPCGLDAPSTWQAMLAGRSGLGPVTRFDATDWPSRAAGEIKGFDADEYFGKRGARRVGLFTQYAIAAADEAFRDAGFAVDGQRPEPERFGVYVGTGIGGFPEIVESAHALFEQGVRAISPLFIPKALNNLASGNLAIRFDARGPSLCVSTACAVGNHSLGEAYRAILFGDAEVILAGGTEACITPLAYGGFMNMRALSRQKDDLHTASRPFDLQRDGFVMAEGAGIVVLEELEHAVRRGARIYAELTGYGTTTDAHHVTAPSPGGDGARRCMVRALQVAGVTPDQVDYINAHGTSTPLNDPNEIAAIRAWAGDHSGRILVSSTKGVTGHALGAAGGIEAVASVLALHTGYVPPTAGLQDPDPECHGVDLVMGQARKADPKVVLSNAFGFGGTNSSLVFAAWED